MQVVFNEILIVNWCPSTPEINRVTVITCHTQDHSCMAPPCISGFAFVTDHVAKMFKNATYFAL